LFTANTFGMENDRFVRVVFRPDFALFDKNLGSQNINGRLVDAQMLGESVGLNIWKHDEKVFSPEDSVDIIQEGIMQVHDQGYQNDYSRLHAIRGVYVEKELGDRLLYLENPEEFLRLNPMQQQIEIASLKKEEQLLNQKVTQIAGELLHAQQTYYNIGSIRRYLFGVEAERNELKKQELFFTQARAEWQRAKTILEHAQLLSARSNQINAVNVKSSVVRCLENGRSSIHGRDIYRVFNHLKNDHLKLEYFLKRYKNGYETGFDRSRNFIIANVLPKIKVKGAPRALINYPPERQMKLLGAYKMIEQDHVKKVAVLEEKLGDAQSTYCQACSGYKQKLEDLFQAEINLIYAKTHLEAVRKQIRYFQCFFALGEYKRGKATIEKDLILGDCQIPFEKALEKRIDAIEKNFSGQKCDIRSFSSEDLSQEFVQVFHIDSDQLGLLLSDNKSPTDLQATMHEELCCILTDTGKLWDEHGQNEYVNKLVEKNVDCIKKGIECAQSNDMVNAINYANIGWAVLGHTQAAATGVFEGVVESAYSLWNTVAHPIQTTKDFIKTTKGTIMLLSEATLECLDLCVVLLVENQDEGIARIKDWAEKFSMAMDIIREEQGEYGITKNYFKMCTQMFLARQGYKAIGNLANLIRLNKTKLIEVLQKAGQPRPGYVSLGRTINKITKTEFFKKPIIKKCYEFWKKVGDKEIHRLKKHAKKLAKKCLGKEAEYIYWDYTHNDLEVFSKGVKPRHLGSWDPSTLKRYKLPDVKRKFPGT